MSKFEGLLDWYKSLSLDRFDGLNLQSTCYWLSHAHSDHMAGLGAKALNSRLKANPRIKIYCTEVTKRLLCHLKPYQHLEGSLVCLNVDEPTSVTVPSRGKDKEFSLVLTAISAGHCPGSAMLLIEGDEANVLYTGDFRLEKGAAGQMAALHDAQGGRKRLDAVYCDATFLTPHLPNIPTRDECEREIIHQIKEHISRGDNYHVLIRAKAKLGYENVFRVIYDELGVKTHIHKQDGYLYAGIPEIVVTTTPNPNESQVHICCRRVSAEGDDDNRGVTLSPSAADLCEALSSGSAVIKVVQLSTMWFVMKEDKRLRAQTGPATVRCCYSFHSSYSEVEDFIHYLRPRRVVPNVYPPGYTRQQTQKLLDDFLSDRSQSPSLEPTDSWNSIKEVDVWWKPAPTVSSGDTADCFSPHPRKRLRSTSGRSDTTASRASTPEINLFSSDSEDNMGQGHAAETVGSVAGSPPEYDSDDESERLVNADYHRTSQQSSLTLGSQSAVTDSTPK